VEDQSARKGVGYFHLVNDSTRQITLQWVETSCNCAVVDDVAGAKIPPGDTYRFSVTASLPRYGLSRSDLRVFYNPSQRPLVLHVEAAGERGMPAIERIANGSPLFLDLQSVDDHDDVVVTTKEEIGSRRWLSGLTCDIPGFESRTVTVEEDPQPSLGLVERGYRFRVGWKHLPRIDDFKAKLFANPVDGGEGLYVGLVSGNVLRAAGPRGN